MDLLTVRYAAMSLDYFAALMLTLVLVCCILEKEKMPLLKLYIAMAAACVVSLLLEAVAYSISFLDWRFADISRIVLCTAAVMGGYCLALFYTCYVANLVGFHRKICQWACQTLGNIGLAAAAVLVIGNCFGLFFTSQKGLFVPGPFFIAIFAFDIIACLTGIVLIILSGQMLNHRDVIALLSLPMLIFLFGLLQYSDGGSMFGLFLLCAVSLLIIYLMIQTDRNHQKIEQEKQLMDMNVALMLSQIQPHFLYNTLSSIRRMIKKDPDVAETAIENFSQYLRQNLESMNQTDPIPFAAELRHVEEYLYLEQLRFGDRLRVEYDIAYSEFTLPVLTLQPIVENAVKHGILQKESGGCVKISAQRSENTVVITVADDGVGFAPEANNAKDRRHIGLENVKNRIKIQCKGTVAITSQVGTGTTVTVIIPLT